MERIITARRAVEPWYFAELHDLVTGRRQAPPEFAKSPTAHACMSIRSQELANLPWRVRRNEEVLDKHPLIDMLKDFGPESSYQQGMAHTELDMLQYGAGLWLRDVDTLKRLDPDTIEVKKSRQGISAFIQKDENGKVVNRFKREEIIYFREYHPEDQLGYGIPIMDVVKKAINAEIEALLMIEAYFLNDAVPGLFLSSEKDIPESEANRVLDWWNKRFRGSRNKHKVGVAGRGLKPVPIGDNLRDSGAIEMLAQCEHMICTGFRVPIILISKSAEATYLNFPESRKFFLEEVISPRAVEYANVINQDLVPYVDPAVVFEFAPEDLPLLQEDENEKQVRLSGMLADGVISEEYYRQQMGIEESAAPEDEVKPEEKRYETKAIKALKRGESPAVPFESDILTIDRRILLDARLKNAKTVDEVRACFD